MVLVCYQGPRVQALTTTLLTQGRIELISLLVKMSYGLYEIPQPIHANTPQCGKDHGIAALRSKEDTSFVKHGGHGTARKGQGSIQNRWRLLASIENSHSRWESLYNEPLRISNTTTSKHVLGTEFDRYYAEYQQANLSADDICYRYYNQYLECNIPDTIFDFFWKTLVNNLYMELYMQAGVIV